MTENHKDSGSFVTGFMFGIAAGAVGYFAFGTQKGTKLRHRLREEWQQAREQLAQPQPTDQPLVQTAHSLFGQIKQVLEHTLVSFERIAQPDVASKKTVKKKRSKASRFKGT